MNLASMLHLDRPLAVLDLETTGLDPETARIWQIAITKFYPDKDPKAWMTLVDPECVVPPEATKQHAEVNERIALEKPHTFKAIAPILVKTLYDVDWAGFNVLYDLRVFRKECKRAGVDWDWEKNGSHVVDALRVFHLNHKRDLSAAYKVYVDERGFEDAHDAAADVAATILVIAGQLEAHRELPRTVEGLANYCFPPATNGLDRQGKLTWINGEACLNFGKHRGKALKHVDTGYLKWIMDGDFPLDVKTIIAAALEGNYPTKG